MMNQLLSNRVVLPQPCNVSQHLIMRVSLYIGIFILHHLLIAKVCPCSSYHWNYWGDLSVPFESDATVTRQKSRPR
jgi:hypothetical protein